MLNCKDSVHGEISLLLEITGERSSELVEALRSLEGITRVYSGSSDKNSFVAVIVTKAPLYCGIARDSGIFCLSCPYASTSQGDSISWKVLVKDLNSMKSTLSSLDSDSGEETRIEEVSNFGFENLLTSRQKEVLLKATQLGYFEFPRKKGLTEIAETIGISPATLSEILRSAEAKIMDYYISMAPKEYQ
ncbi:MAG: helix-turn-helix domain-containing protein [Nitrososphaerales archaeon]